MSKSYLQSARLGILSLGLALGASGVAAAQTDTPSGTGNSSGTVTTAPRSTTADNRDDRGFNPGWLGLLGLAGLAGLIPLFTRNDRNDRARGYDNRTTTGQRTNS